MPDKKSQTMPDGKRERITVTNGGPGLLWFAAWLFTVGYVKLGFWSGLLALMGWPWFLGNHFSVPAGG